jgi:hypothetical protein
LGLTAREREIRHQWLNKQREGNMNNKFDELTKHLAQSVTRRGALKKSGVGLASIALACFGLANKAHAGQKCGDGYGPCPGNQVCWYGYCRKWQPFP